MTAKIAFGWGVSQAVNGQSDFGRMAYVGGPYWSQNHTAGVSGYDAPPGGTNEYEADSDAVTDAMLRWIAQKPVGALDLLIVQATGSGDTNFGTEFRDGLTRLGHTWTLTESASNWLGFEPLDYDVLISPPAIDASSYHGITNAAAKFDYVLANQGGLLTQDVSASSFDRYGFNASGFHTFHSSPYQRPFSAAALGAGTFKLVSYSSLKMTAVTNTKGGSSQVYFCDTHPTEGVVGLWSQT